MTTKARLRRFPFRGRPVCGFDLGRRNSAARPFNFDQDLAKVSDGGGHAVGKLRSGRTLGGAQIGERGLRGRNSPLPRPDPKLCRDEIDDVPVASMPDEVFDTQPILQRFGLKEPHSGEAPLKQ